MPGCGSPTLPPSAPSALFGKSLPRIGLPTLDGTVLDGAKLVGRPVVVKFFADYCEPCKRTLPAAERLSAEYPSVRFVGVSEDDDSSTAQEVAARYHITFPVVHDEDHALLGRFRVHELPTTFVADAGETVRWIGGPGQTERELEQAILAVKP
jgi:thiol-disulfide isomerase/thioredoxin